MRMRKTIDTWEIQGYYQGKWEDECTEFNRHDAKAQLRTYRENSSYPVRVVRRREPRANYSAEQLATIEQRNREAVKEWAATRLAKRQAQQVQPSTSQRNEQGEPDHV